MENEKYMQEGLDMKRLFLCFADKLWQLPVAIIVGALIGMGVYLLSNFVFNYEKEYQSLSKVYLDFNCEPEDFNQLSYNGYTWNDLVVTDPILNYTMEELSPDISRETVIAATKAEILSDIRLLTITITTDRPELTAQIMSATQEALVHLGETDDLFHSIKIYSTTEPEQIVWDNRILNAAITGAVIALFLVVVGMALYYSLDDSIYVQADSEKRYGIPAIGIMTDEEPSSFQSFGNEFLANYKYLCRGLGKVSLMSVECAGDADKAKQTMERILSMGNTSEDYILIPMPMPQRTPDVYESIRRTDGVVLVVRYGKRNGKLVELAISNLKKQDCKILGILIVEANVRFLRRYYMGKKEKRIG